MTKKAFSQYVPATDSETTLSACRDELQREFSTRKRLYDRWVAEGKCTWQEAHDRMRRIMGAMLFLDQFVPDNSVLTLEKHDTANTAF